MDKTHKENFQQQSYSPFYLKDYNFGQKLGSGAFATVYLCYKKEDGKRYAIKVIDLEMVLSKNKKIKEQLNTEIEIMREFKHPNLVSLNDVIIESDKKYICLVLEYCKGGDFSNFLKLNGPQLPEEQAKYFTKQLLSGLKYLRSKGIVHRDLKPQNLLLTSLNPSKMKLKIADFGFAKYVRNSNVLLETVCGSPLYMAPEILKQQKYDDKADLWSVGVILFEMVFGVLPFMASNLIELIQKLDTPLVIPHQMGPSGQNNTVSNECLYLLLSLLRVDSVSRISWEELFEHPFLKNKYERQHSQQNTKKSSCSVIDKRRGVPDEGFSKSIPNSLPVQIITPRTNILKKMPDSTWPPKQPKTNPFKETVHEGDDLLEKSFEIMENNKDDKKGEKGEKDINLRSFYKTPSEISKSVYDVMHSFIQYDSEISDKNKEENLEKVGKSLEQNLKRITMVVELGDSKNFEINSQNEKLTLYMKALESLKYLLSSLKKTIIAERIKNNKNLRYYIDVIIQKFVLILKKVEFWKRNNYDMKYVFCAEKIIFLEALKLGKEAVISETLQDYTKAVYNYTKGIDYLEYLFNETKFEEDKISLKFYTMLFEKRKNGIPSYFRKNELYKI